MPGHFTHVYTARRVADLLESGEFQDWPEGGQEGAVKYAPERLGEIMKMWDKFTAVGAVGPDLFYFSQDYNNAILGPISDELMLTLAVYYFYDYSKEHDWEPLLIILEKVNATFAAVVRFLLELDKIWKKFKQAWDDTIGPFVQAADTALDDLTGGLVSSFQDALGELLIALKGLAKQELFTWQDIFTNFDTCIAKGLDEQSFLWSDMSHYRRTSELARNLVAVAETPSYLEGEGDWPTTEGEDDSDCDDKDNRFEQFMAFALGWITHLGTDTIAHSFVNEQCGGPFRHHPQRHHLIENHIDAWNYRQAATSAGNFVQDEIGSNDTFPDLSNSAFWYQVQFNPGNPCGRDRPGEIADDPDQAKQDVDRDGVMPMWMANAIVRALVATFGEGEPGAGERWTHPRIYGGSDFQDRIDEGMLTRIVKDVTGHALDRPFQDLLDDIAPAPPPSFRVPHGYPLPWQVRTVYFFMNTFFKLSFWGGWELAKPREPDVVIWPPPEDVDDLLEPPDFNGPSSGDPLEDVCDAIKSFFDWIEHEVEAAIKLAGDLVKMLASPGSYPVRWVLYQLAMMAWDIVCKTHEIMAHTGFLIPHGEQHYDDGELKLPNEIDIPLITLGGSADDAFKQALADAIDPIGNLDRNLGLLVEHDVTDPNYPYYTAMKVDTNGDPVRGKIAPWSTEDTMIPEEYHRPWAYPDQSPDEHLVLHHTPSEEYDATKPGGDLDASGNPPTVTRRPLSGPYPRKAKPDVFFGDRGPDAGARAAYEAARTPRETDSLNEQHLLSDAPSSPLGDPVPFSAYLIGRLANDTGYATQFNLDSDRAYAYLTWDWIRSDETVRADLPFDYRAPNTWPSLSKDWAGPLTKMQLEYVDQVPRIFFDADEKVLEDIDIVVEADDGEPDARGHR